VPRLLSTDEARRFYDHFGSKQDDQGWYEDRAIDRLLAVGALAEAESVFELGCGTGRLAARLLGDLLPPTARYVGTDLSSTMLDLARPRIEPWSDRARLFATDGSLTFPDLADGSFDRVVSTYVFDLLDDEPIARALAECRRLLAPGGRLCLAGITFGDTPLSRLVSWGWTRVHALSPRLVGGCRPLRMNDRLSADRWTLRHDETVVVRGVASEILVADAA